MDKVMTSDSEKLSSLTDQPTDSSGEKKIKVAIVTQPWDVIVGISSIAIIAYQLAQRLAHHCDVTIYAKRGPSQPKVEWDAHGVQIRRVSTDAETKLLKLIRLAYRFGGPRDRTRPYYARSWYYQGYILQVARDLKQQQYDIVHLFNFSQFVPVIRSLNPEAKIVLHMQCEWLTQLDPKLIEPRISQADLIIGCSGYITNKVRHRFPQTADGCQTLFNAVDHNRFSSEVERGSTRTDGIKRLLYVGRLSPEKGLHVLMEAFKLVAQHNSQVEMEIVGPPGEVPYEFIALGDDNGLTTNLTSFYTGKIRSGYGSYFSYLQQQLPPDLAAKVFFRGSVDQSGMVDYYRNADIFVFPSVWNEPFGIPLVEAMACEVPVVATKSGGMTEIVEDGKTGFLVERGDADALAKAITTLIHDDALRETMGKAGYQRVLALFTWDGAAEQLLQHYENVVANGS